MIFRIILFLALALFLSDPGTAQPAQDKHSAGSFPADKPRLVVGIVVDQMRYDYLERYAHNFGKNGFKRLLRKGFSCRQANYSYVPTHTAPGHACIYTGAPPAVTGIVGNDWFDRDLRMEVYCVTDTSVKPVGTTSADGMMSPHRLRSATVTDALREATGFRSKVIGISLKDRGAILPAGHKANAAYWHDPSTNTWVSSSYYMKELPAWLSAYNARHRADTFLSKPWIPLLPLEKYTASMTDATPYEGLFIGETQPVFPHPLPVVRDKEPQLLRKTPFGNTFTLEAAMEAIRGEKLGKGEATDFLAISFSSTDYIGHMYGLRAMELEDAYVRLDRDIATLLTFLDEWAGPGNTLVFLTADHGAADNVQYCLDRKLGAGNLVFQPVADSLQRLLERQYGPGGYILNSSTNGIYFDRPLLKSKNADLATAQNLCADYLRNQPWAAAVATSANLEQGLYTEGLMSFLQRGFFAPRSPDVSMVLQPGWMEWVRPTGTTHGSPYAYDTHVPLLFYGWKIAPGGTDDSVDVCDIAPTVAHLLRIDPPAGSTGKPIPALNK